MGCNTSKESVQQAVEEAKEDVKGMAKDIVRDLLKDESAKEEPKNGDVPKSVDTAPAAEESTPADSAKEEAKDSASQEEDDKSKEEEAATRIQAAFRGHHTRKNLKETEPETAREEQQETPLSIKDKLKQEVQGEVKELCGVASKAQESLREHMSKKVEQAAGAAKELVEKVEEKVSDTVDELEGIDLSDPDLHKAATKIQASFRGHKVRQEVPIPNVDEKK
ncbi:neuromodulin [Copidosoma floridanum]|uniref:neuromodulin n=1 Tax=Copidosoma floridanum TaxID=29053 RepID=UPI0006C98629|nr:neuromodulin [Copidosoma floridanum]